VRPKFGGLAKLHLDQEMKVVPNSLSVILIVVLFIHLVLVFNTLECSKEPGGDVINVEFHHLERNQFCSGATFVAKANASHEDDGWIISFVHDECTNVSQACLNSKSIAISVLE
jgi:hypothetical protein